MDVKNPLKELPRIGVQISYLRLQSQIKMNSEHNLYQNTPWNINADIMNQMQKLGSVQEMACKRLQDHKVIEVHVPMKGSEWKKVPHSSFRYSNSKYLHSENLANSTSEQFGVAM